MADDLADQLATKRRLVELTRRKLTLAKDNGLAFYRPHAKQHLFHIAPHKRRGLFAGNRTGKSDGNATETCGWMIGERVWYKRSFDILSVRYDPAGTREIYTSARHEGHDSHPFVRQGIPPWPTKQLIVTTNWDKVDEIWTSQAGDRPGKLWRYLPANFAKKTCRNHEGIIDEVHGHNGSLLKFLSIDAFKKNPLVVESSDWDRVAFDEPGPEDAWKGCARGLTDRNGQGDFTLTPLSEMWISDYFFGENVDPRDRFAIRATSYDNPYLSNEALRMFELELTDDERQCRLQGLPLELSGLVYKEFRRDRHVLTKLPEGWTDWDTPPYSWSTYAAIDPHPQTPHAVLFIAVSPHGHRVVYDEIYQHTGIDSLVELIQYKLRFRTVGTIKCDPIAWIFDPMTESCMAERMMQLGLYVEKASKAKEFGILNLRSVFKRDPLAGGLSFTPTVKRTLWELGRYCYDKENKPVDKDDHMMENLYRLMINNPIYVAPTISTPIPAGAVDLPTFSEDDLSNLSASEY